MKKEGMKACVSFPLLDTLSIVIAESEISAEELIKKLKEKFKAEGGRIIIMYELFLHKLRECPYVEINDDHIVTANQYTAEALELLQNIKQARDAFDEYNRRLTNVNCG